MTTLQGGVSYNSFGGGGGGGIGGGTPWGEIAKQVNKAKASLKNTFADAADNANMTALAASNYRPSFTPIAGNFVAPQQMQTQQSQVSNLYDYLIR
jgi:hypothetical protein